MAIQFSVQEAAAAMGPLDKVIALLQDFGFFRVVLPFLLVFAIVYAILIKTKVLGDPQTQGFAKSASAIIALVIGFLVIVYTPVVDTLGTLLPQAGFILVVVVLLLMVLAMFGIKFEPEAGEKFPPWAAAIAIIVFVIFLAAIGLAAVNPATGQPYIPILHTFGSFLLGAIPVDLPDETWATIAGVVIILAIVGGTIFLVTKSD